MPYRLQDDLSFCKVDGRTIFLDTQSDSYFRLAANLEHAFRTFIAGEEISDTELDALVERRILAEDATSGTRGSPVCVDPAAFSAIEQASRHDCIGIGTLLDVFGIVGLTRWQLAKNSLGQVVSAVTTYRDSNTSSSTDPLTKADTEHLLGTAAAFWLVRPYVPIEPRCLLDSLSMIKFLAKRKLHASLIFGVTGDPFSAHAWAQTADVVLTDSVGNVSAHTPIRVA